MNRKFGWVRIQNFDSFNKNFGFESALEQRFLVNLAHFARHAQTQQASRYADYDAEESARAACDRQTKAWEAKHTQNHRR